MAVAEALRSSPGAALRYRDFRYFQCARLTSVISSEMLAVAVAWQVYTITHRPLSLGYVGLAQFCPSFLLFLVAGHAVDRFDRRRVLLAVQFLYAVSAGLLLADAGLHWRGAAPIYAVMVMQGTVRAFGGPAGQALMPQLVDAADFTNAVVWGSNTFQAATILGPALGSLLFGWFNGGTVYALAAAGYLAALGFTWAIHTRTGRMEERDTSVETVLAGLRYIFDHPVILGSISLDLFAVLLGGATALLPFFCDLLHAGVWGVGLLKSSFAAGAMAMALLLAFFPLRRGVGATMMACVALFGLATVGFGLSRNLALSVLLLALMGASDMVSVVVRQTLVQIQTPGSMRGRVSAVNLLFIGTSNQFGEFESGVTGQWWGFVRATIYGGLGTLAVVGLWWRFFPQLRRVRTLTLEEPG